MLEADQVAALIEACRLAFDVSPDAEITIEINPAGLSSEKIQGWIGAGVNRASLGVQSFIDRELAFLGRTHTADQARRALDALRWAGFENISLDLIAGLPGQALSNWEFNLQEALIFKPEHLSLYLLEVKEGTQLHAQIKRGLCPEPDEDLAAEAYRLTCDLMRRAGYEHYEISNFALSAVCRSRHNMKYWTGAPFYGVGCGAHSYDGRARWANMTKTESYIESVCRSGRAIAEYRELTVEERAAEVLLMGLRLIEGIDLDWFRAEYEVDVMSRYGEELRKFEQVGLLEVSGGRLRLTERGLLLSNEVFLTFV
jgi:oxygen-independent coproporphyrinogen-3 oxidase